MDNRTMLETLNRVRVYPSDSTIGNGCGRSSVGPLAGLAGRLILLGTDFCGTRKGGKMLSLSQVVKRTPQVRPDAMISRELVRNGQTLGQVVRVDGAYYYVEPINNAVFLVSDQGLLELFDHASSISDIGTKVTNRQLLGDYPQDTRETDFLGD